MEQHIHYSTTKHPFLIQTIIGVNNESATKRRIITNGIANVQSSNYDDMTEEDQFEYILDLYEKNKRTSMKKVGYCEISNTIQSEDDLLCFAFYDCDLMLGSATRSLIYHKKYEFEAKLMNFIYMFDVGIIKTNINNRYWDEENKKLNNTPEVYFYRSSGKKQKADSWSNIFLNQNYNIFGIDVYFKDSDSDSDSDSDPESNTNSQTLQKFIPINSIVVDGFDIKPFEIVDKTDQIPFKLSVSLPSDIPVLLKSYKPYNEYIQRIEKEFNQAFGVNGWEREYVSLNSLKK